MDDLCCHISLICDNVITPIIEGADDSQLMVERVVGAKTQVLIGVGNLAQILLIPCLSHSGLRIGKCFCYLLSHENINIPSEEQILFTDLCIRQLGNMLSEACSVLGKESTKSLPNFPSFLKLLKAFRFQKGASIIPHNFRPYYQMPKYIGKDTRTFYAMSIHKIYNSY